MIAPRLRLVAFTVILITPLAALAGLIPPILVAAVALCAMALMLVLFDAILSLNRLDGVKAALPDVARMTQDKDGTITLLLDNGAPSPIRVRIGLALPRECPSPQDAVEAIIPANTHACLVTWSCAPIQRGRYHLDAVHMETTSRLGFWAIRRVCKSPCEVRVYPNLARDRRQVAALFLNRGMLGIHAMRQIGQGRDFEKLREYVPGDGYDDIHWKATAKRGRPITKVYQIEKTQEVYVFIDASRLSARTHPGVPAAGDTDPPRPQPILERFLTASLVLALAAQRQGDHFGLVVFNDRVRRFIRASSGKAHYGVCRDALYTLEPQLVNPDYEALCAFTRLRLRRRALIVVLSCLDDPVLAESFARNVQLISRHHLVLVNMPAPLHIRPIFSEPAPESPEGLYDDLAGHLEWRSLRELERYLHRWGVNLSLLRRDHLAAELVTQYVNVKQRQAL